MAPRALEVVVRALRGAPWQVRLRALPRYPRAPALVGVEKVANGELGALLARVNADSCAPASGGV